jgi:hypothetical protein
MIEKRKTVGKVATDLIQQDAPTRDPIELERAMHEDYEKNVWECVVRSQKDYLGDFYIVVLTKKEKLLENVLRHFFFGRSSCPTPDYDQAVYKYHREHDALEFLWVVPSKPTCEYLRDNALDVIESERDLLKFVLDFYDDTLMIKAKKLNREELETPLLVTP